MSNNLEKQFSKIYDQNIEKIYRFVFLKVNSEEIAEDITSKVFLNGWEAYRNQEIEIKNPKAFLYQIARNKVIDHYREKGRVQFVSTDSVPNMADTGTSIEDRAIINADLVMVKKAIAGMSDDYQNVVIWHYLDGLSIKETAELLERSEEATRVLLHRALGTLRETLTN